MKHYKIPKVSTSSTLVQNVSVSRDSNNKLDFKKISILDSTLDSINDTIESEFKKESKLLAKSDRSDKTDKSVKFNKKQKSIKPHSDSTSLTPSNLNNNIIDSDQNDQIELSQSIVPEISENIVLNESLVPNDNVGSDQTDLSDTVSVENIVSDPDHGSNQTDLSDISKDIVPENLVPEIAENIVVLQSESEYKDSSEQSIEKTIGVNLSEFSQSETTSAKKLIEPSDLDDPEYDLDYESSINDSASDDEENGDNENSDFLSDVEKICANVAASIEASKDVKFINKITSTATKNNTSKLDDTKNKVDDINTINEITEHLRNSDVAADNIEESAMDVDICENVCDKEVSVDGKDREENNVPMDVEVEESHENYEPINGLEVETFDDDSNVTDVVRNYQEIFRTRIESSPIFVFDIVNINRTFLNKADITNLKRLKTDHPLTTSQIKHYKKKNSINYQNYSFVKLKSKTAKEQQAYGFLMFTDTPNVNDINPNTTNTANRKLIKGNSYKSVIFTNVSILNIDGSITNSNPNTLTSPGNSHRVPIDHNQSCLNYTSTKTNKLISLMNVFNKFDLKVPEGLFNENSRNLFVASTFYQDALTVKLKKVNCKFDPHVLSLGLGVVPESQSNAAIAFTKQLLKIYNSKQEKFDDDKKHQYYFTYIGQIEMLVFQYMKISSTDLINYNESLKRSSEKSLITKIIYKLSELIDHSNIKSFLNIVYYNGDLDNKDKVNYILAYSFKQFFANILDAFASKLEVYENYIDMCKYVMSSLQLHHYLCHHTFDKICNLNNLNNSIFAISFRHTRKVTSNCINLISVKEIKSFFNYFKILEGHLNDSKYGNLYHWVNKFLYLMIHHLAQGILKGGIHHNLVGTHNLNKLMIDICNDFGFKRDTTYKSSFFLPSMTSTINKNIKNQLICLIVKYNQGDYQHNIKVADDFIAKFLNEFLSILHANFIVYAIINLNRSEKDYKKKMEKKALEGASSSGSDKTSSPSEPQPSTSASASYDSTFSTFSNEVDEEESEEFTDETLFSVSELKTYNILKSACLLSTLLKEVIYTPKGTIDTIDDTSDEEDSDFEYDSDDSDISYISDCSTDNECEREPEYLDVDELEDLKDVDEYESNFPLQLNVSSKQKNELKKQNLQNTGESECVKRSVEKFVYKSLTKDELEGLDKNQLYNYKNQTPSLEVRKQIQNRTFDYNQGNVLTLFKMLKGRSNCEFCYSSTSFEFDINMKSLEKSYKFNFTRYILKLCRLCAASFILGSKVVRSILIKRIDERRKSAGYTYVSSKTHRSKEDEQFVKLKKRGDCYRVFLTDSMLEQRMIKENDISDKGNTNSRLFIQKGAHGNIAVKKNPAYVEETIKKSQSDVVVVKKSSEPEFILKTDAEIEIERKKNAKVSTLNKIEKIPKEKSTPSKKNTKTDTNEKEVVNKDKSNKKKELSKEELSKKESKNNDLNVSKKIDNSKKKVVVDRKEKKKDDNKKENVLDTKKGTEIVVVDKKKEKSIDNKKENALDTKNRKEIVVVDKKKENKKEIVLDTRKTKKVRENVVVDKNKELVVKDKKVDKKNKNDNPEKNDKKEKVVDRKNKASRVVDNKK